MNNADREGLISQNGDRPLDDRASARLSAGAGIVLPSVDHPFGCALPSVGAARTLPLRLRRAVDAFDPRLDRFFAIASLLLLHRRRVTLASELAVVAATRLSPLRGDAEVR